jgi:hypothetical protein
MAVSPIAKTQGCRIASFRVFTEAGHDINQDNGTTYFREGLHKW